MKKSKSIGSLFIVILGIMLLWSPHTLATDYAWEVNSTGDDGDDSTGDSSCATSAGECTLRAAIHESNVLAASGDTFTITFAESTTICLSDLLYVGITDASITIQGHDDGTVLDGGNSSETGTSCASSSNMLVFVYAADNITLKNLTLQGGAATSGAGMNIYGAMDSLTISNSSFQYNETNNTTADTYGGAIYASQAITSFSVSETARSPTTRPPAVRVEAMAGRFTPKLAQA